MKELRSVGTFVDGPHSTPNVSVAEVMTRARTQALFTPSTLTSQTRSIDPPKASLEAIHLALEDCDFYWGTAYPETENELVEWIEDGCIKELKQRLRGTILDGMIKKLPSRYGWKEWWT